MTPRQFAALKSRLILGSRLLAIAALIQPLMFLPFGPEFAKKMFALVFVSSALFAIVGFVIAWKPLGLANEASDGVHSLRHIGWKGQSGVVLMFCGAFLVPLLNLVIIAWAWFRIRGALQALAVDREQERRREGQRSRLRSG